MTYHSKIMTVKLLFETQAQLVAYENCFLENMFQQKLANFQLEDLSFEIQHGSARKGTWFHNAYVTFFGETSDYVISIFIVLHRQIWVCEIDVNGASLRKSVL